MLMIIPKKSQESSHSQQLNSKNRPVTAPGTPFRTAEEAWFWFICAVEAREEGASPGKSRGNIPRPCEPLDIYKTLERIYRNRRLRFDHMRVLNYYGRRRLAPDAFQGRESDAHRLWREAMNELDVALQRRGIVQNIFQRVESL